MEEDCSPPPFDPQTDALFLDFDGTVVEFADDPDAVRLPPGGLRLLQELEEALGGALVMVTGRRIDSLDRMITPLTPAAGGLHGLEVREAAGGPVRSLPVPGAIEQARQRLHELVASSPGLRVEDKGAALVVHFRGAPELSGRAELIANRAAAGLEELRVVAGHAIYEVRLAGVGKDHIVRGFMQMPRFSGRTPVFLGDDRTDEDGFGAARALGGYGVKVGPGRTDARYRLADVASVHAYLRRAVAGGDAADAPPRPEPGRNVFHEAACRSFEPGRPARR